MMTATLPFMTAYVAPGQYGKDSRRRETALFSSSPTPSKKGHVSISALFSLMKAEANRFFEGERGTFHLFVVKLEDLLESYRSFHGFWGRRGKDMSGSY
jgi:hypothetical protein